MTFRELVEGLNDILINHPELADREVIHSSEGGYSGAGFESPVTVAIPNPAAKFANINHSIHIVSDDDGYRTNPAIESWTFISTEVEE